MTPTQFIIVAAVVILLCFISYVAGFRNGREDERKEAEITKRKEARRLLVGNKVSSFCCKDVTVNTPPLTRNEGEWFQPKELVRN